MNSRLDEAKVVERIAEQGITCESHPIVPGCWKVLDGDLLRTASFQDGLLYLQDPASQLIPFLLETKPEHSCLDVCAAPGGKLSQIAKLSGGEGFLIGMDLRWQRLRSAAKLHLRNWPSLCLVVADGRKELPFSCQFDRILVDAPCSGTATLQRNPDIRWRLSPEDILRLQATQLAILKSAAKQLKTGGTIVYSTCSLEEEENESVIELFLESHSEFRLARPQVPRLQPIAVDGGFFKLFPSEWNNDGFFAAVLKRESATG